MTFLKKFFSPIQKNTASTSEVLLRKVGFIGLIFLFSLLVASLLTFNLDNLPQTVTPGSIALSDIRADQNYEIIDQRSTNKLKEDAIREIKVVYDYDPQIENEILGRIRAAFSQARSGQGPSFNETSSNENKSENEEVRKAFQQSLALVLTNEQYDVLERYKFDSSIEKALTVLIHEIMKQPIVHSLEEIKPFIQKGTTMRRLAPVEPYFEENVTDISRFIDMKDVEKKLAEAKLKIALDEGPAALKEIQSVVKDIASTLIKVNVTYSSPETEKRRQKVQANIKDIVIKIKRGESIIRAGDHFDEWHLAVIDGMRKDRLNSKRAVHFIGIFVFVNLAFVIFYSYGVRFLKRFKPSFKDLLFLGLSFVTALLILRFGVFLSAPIQANVPINTSVNLYYYLIPIAGSAMMVRLILNSELALLFSFAVSLLCGIFLENNLELSIYYLISSIFGALVIARADRRSTVILAGIYTGLVNVVSILAISLINYDHIESTLTFSELLWNLTGGFLGGIFSSMVVLMITPVFESLFNYTTDIKLLELANMSHPLLKEMIVTAPGTYHHSQIVGILSEAGAQAIGANALLTRVACYYHDIGKMKKPQYFIENQRGENPHDKLAPSMSALIIESHVKDGIEMAREHKLPKKIIDMIPQHQGTKLIGYFYNKALKMADPLVEKVDPKDYRYIGPKPQTQEAGIIMLADTIEAAVRSMSEKTPQKMRSMVEKLVNQHFVDEQLDECDLTLRDIHLIAEAFIKILIGIYHQRIEYPENANAENLPHANSNLQSSSQVSNISPLFRSKDS